MEDYQDSQGVKFDDLKLWLPTKARDWPRPARLKDSVVCERMHAWYGSPYSQFYKGCWACGARGIVLEAHHMMAGMKGRSDEYTAILMLCHACHEHANTPKLSIARQLYLKWKHDRQHLSWFRLALLHGRWLPDLQAEPR